MRQDGNSAGLESGMIIGERYSIVGKLGSGGMGDVYAAEDLKLQGKLRAVKVTDSEIATEESRMLMRLSHPNLPHIIDSFPLTGYGTEAIVMDYIHGLTVGELFKRQMFTFKDVLRIAVPVCSALVYLHSQSPPIIHRDLKPSNIMVEHNGHVRLIDFGIAKSRIAMQTQTTMKLGTPGFAAPEQHMGRSEARSDIYGFGALLYYLLSEGRYLNNADMTGQISHFSRQLQADVPSRFADMLLRMVQPRVENRYPSMADVEKELRTFAGSWSDKYPVANGTSGTNRTVSLERGGLRVAILSASPGAGATFVAITLARLLAARGLPCSAAEFPRERPEWAVLLRRDMRGRDQLEDRYHSWNEHGVWWHAQQHPIMQDQRTEMDKLELRLGRKGPVVAITDLPAGMAQHRKEWILESDIVIAVADPYPSRWRTDELMELAQLSKELSANGSAMVWVTNKDAKFQGRNEWLSLLPAPPIAAIPMLPAAEWLDILWRGKWVTEVNGMGTTLEKAFRPLIEYILKAAR
ncbi:serine/threonine-protein kinase [Paenibacillus glycanilyticus]|uniref:non-specific serine/threonine protein kinase n=1 Tax=Paenibacillus glycanilyticus TaxID=126569 RepID=A0ABQ6GAY8_9BACL|nr:serine/threonine-protein kinase [Paenibacillus glycanilyticus]GLX68114.1 hypothetical protein MU1_24590 [Paenibacillus glycanilyticus]